MTALASPTRRPSGRYAGDGETSPVERYVWYPVVVPPPQEEPRSLRGCRAVVLGGGDATRADVVSALESAGARVALVPRGGPDDAPERAAAVADAAVRSADRVDLVVDLTLEPPFVPAEHGLWRSALAQTVAVLQALHEDWSIETDARRCGYVAVTWMGGRMGYDGRSVAQPLGGIWSGLAKSLPHEMPTCSLKVLDLPAAHSGVGSLVVGEVGVWDYYEVGWRDGVRVTLGCRPDLVPQARLTLGPGDVVLITGGGRGLGFALARSLAQTTGCSVVVTGRAALLDDGPDGCLADLDEEQFRELLTARLRDAAGGGRLAEVRRDNERLADARTLSRNLAGTRAQGLDVVYRTCDVLDPPTVACLIHELGDRLRIVVHNAGIASPVRLPRKSVQTVLDVVACKLEGFVSLVEALGDRSVDLICNVGSASGRLGGMPGQIDYAAANEVLSRLGFWAGEQRGLPVTTCAWTTWERLGLIANFDAALRYGAAVKVEEGLRRWSEELLAARPGEVMFLGRVGTALVPSQLRGFLKLSDHPDLARLQSLHHWLGEVEEYVPFHRVTSRNRILGGPPLGTELRLAGDPLLPVSVALEYAVSVGDWVVPEGWPPCRLAEVRGLDVDLRALRLGEEGLTLVKQGSGSRVEGRWTVDVRLSRADDGREVLHACLAYDEPALAGLPADEDLSAADAPVLLPPEDSRSELGWSGVAFPPGVAPAQPTPGVLCVQPTRPADLWPLPGLPQHRLPSAGLEAVLQRLAASAGAPQTPRHLHVDQLVVAGTGPESAVERVGRSDWQVLDSARRPLLRVLGTVLS